VKVKIGDKIYDGNKEPILLILTEGDKRDIQNMTPEATRFCIYPDEGYSYDEICKWIEDRNDELL
jgi:hypothetical protein